MLITDRLYPEKLLIRTTESEALLKGFTRHAKIKVVRRKWLDALDEAVDDILEQFEENDSVS